MKHASLDNHARPITWSRPFRGTIVAGETALSGLTVRFGTFKRKNRARLKVSLVRVRTGERKSVVLAAENLVDNEFVTFRFAAFENVMGEIFNVSVRSMADRRNCVAVFVTPAGSLEAAPIYGELVLGGQCLVLPSGLIVRAAEAASPPSQDGSDDLTVAVVNWWVDRFGIYLEGSLTLARTGTARQIRLASAESIAALSFEPVSPVEYRFSGYLACRPGEPIRLLVDTENRCLETRVVLPNEPIPHPPSPDLFLRFIELVNREKTSVLEVGSRASSPFAVCNRPHFQPHVRFIGFDFLAGENTDMVGDAHQLTRYFPERSLGAAYSLTVLEHLVMPWCFAVELNRVLEVGGLVFHATHQTWPVHAAPNDFYRFSDEALKFLFGPDSGFEVIGSHMEHRFWLYPEYRTEAYLTTPLSPGYGNSQVLARKVRHLEAGWTWESATDQVTNRSMTYPRYEPA